MPGYDHTFTAEVKTVNTEEECNGLIAKGWKLLRTHWEGEKQLATVYVMARPESVAPEEPIRMSFPEEWPK